VRLGDLLIRAKRVTEADVTEALERGRRLGGRLGDNLVATGAIDQKTLDGFLHRIPVEPSTIAATGVNEKDLIGLLVKLIYTRNISTLRQCMQGIKLPYHIVSELARMAVDAHLLQTLGMHNSQDSLDMGYILTEEGRRWAIDALKHSNYAGPAPIPLDEFSEQVNLQKLTNEIITIERLRASVADLQVEEEMIEQIGPALNSGRAILLYGPPGNGKSSVALRFASVFQDIIYIPYAVAVEGQIIRVFDPSVHIEVPLASGDDAENTSFVRQDLYDARWIPCRRPLVVAGGELTMEMLDLRYETTSHTYEAPLHMKALGGCFLIDDFGRQLMSPANLLNRWIVPLESRVDYLKLHNGKSFRIPFEEMVIFSTNLEPEELMDPAFLRRLHYKIEVGAPDVTRFKQIFQVVCEQQGLSLPDEVFNEIVRKIKTEKMLGLAAFYPKFIVDQVVATCRFMGQAPHFEPRFIDYAVDNLRVRRTPRPE
jgi:DNA polymerase III delta prime subunit